MIMFEDKTVKLRGVLVGIELSDIKSKPIHEFARWKTYRIPPFTHIQQALNNHNFQINGHGNEKIVVRIWINSDRQITKTRYYYLNGIDKELASYIVRALLKFLEPKFPLAPTNEIKVINY